jgi:hypothetical protein
MIVSRLLFISNFDLKIGICNNRFRSWLLQSTRPTAGANVASDALSVIEETLEG